MSSKVHNHCLKSLDLNPCFIRLIEPKCFVQSSIAHLLWAPWSAQWMKLSALLQVGRRLVLSHPALGEDVRHDHGGVDRVHPHPGPGNLKC